MRGLRLTKAMWVGLAMLLGPVSAIWGQGYTPVTVMVTDASGAAVAGADIRVTPGSPAGDRLVTDEHGRLQLGMPAGKYQVQIAIVPLDSISWVDLPVFPPS